MLKSYFTIAWRYLRKNRIFSLINVLGLAIGLACCILIALFVWDELHYDTYPPAADRIYRVEINLLANNGVQTYPNVDIAVGDGIARNFPEIAGYTRFSPWPKSYWTVGNRQFKEDRIGFADSNFFSFFGLPLIKGNAATALADPNSVVISAATARKYFGDSDPIGRTIEETGEFVLKVTGVMDPIPDNSHFHFDVVVSMSTLHRTGHTWSNTGYYTYVMLNKGADPKKVEAGMPDLVAKYVVPEVQHDMGVTLAEAQKSVNTFRFFLQPLRTIHLRADSKYELEHNGDIQNVYIFSALAIFILVLACVNFTNLSTAIASKRGREVGIRKVLGSLKSQLAGQFLTEAVLLTFLALVAAIGLALLLLPQFNELSGKHFTYRSLIDYRALATLLLLGLLTGVCAGGYPAFFLSAFNAINMLKGTLLPAKTKRVSLRSGLVVFQFFISTSLMIATLIIYRQLQYMQDRKLGYDKEQVVYLQDTYVLGTGDAQQTLRRQLMQDPRVVNVSIGTNLPGNEDIGGTIIYPGEGQANGGDNSIPTNLYFVDYDYIPTLGMKIVGGRNFSRDFATDSAGVILNESAVRDLGWSRIDPVGKTIIGSKLTYKVVGVVADFNYVSLKQKIAPLMMRLYTGPAPGMIVKVNARNMTGFLNDLQQKWKTLNPRAPFSYYFLDDKFAALYSGEQKTARLFGLFALLSIGIAGLGLFGLAAFSTQQRAKEISIRKVLGASVQGLLLLMAKEFLLLVGVAFLLAAPVTGWLMHAWLQDFAYRTPIAAWVFLFAGFITALIAVITVSSRALGAALSNPVKVLRSE